MVCDCDLAVFEALDNGQRFHADTLFNESVTPVLEGFLDDKAHAGDLRARLICQINNAFAALP